MYEIEPFFNYYTETIGKPVKNIKMTMNLNYEPYVLWFPPLFILFFGGYSLFKSNLNLKNIFEVFKFFIKTEKNFS